jgi:hypothetical protein
MIIRERCISTSIPNNTTDLKLCRLRMDSTSGVYIENKDLSIVARCKEPRRPKSTSGTVDPSAGGSRNISRRVG